MIDELPNKNIDNVNNPKIQGPIIPKRKKSKRDNSPTSSSKKLDGYESQEDLERLLRISSSDSNVDKNIKNEDQESISIDNRKNFKLKTYDTSLFNSYRILNSLSIIILLLTFYSTTISQIKNKKEYSFIIEFLRRDKIQAESNLIVLSIAFCFITCNNIFINPYIIPIVSSILALIRNIFISTEGIYEADNSLIDIQTTITKHFKYFYSTGNFLFSICLISNHIQILEEYGVNFFLCVNTLIFYSLAYYNHKVKGVNLKLKGIFNKIAFSLNLSFLLAWNASYITITFATFLSCFKLPASYLYFVNLSLQSLLTVLVVLALSYFQDLGFSFIILFFQWGNTLNENIFKFESFNKENKEEKNDLTEINDRFNLNLILTVFTTICFLSSAMFYYIKNENRMKDKFINELTENYKVDGEKAYL